MLAWCTRVCINYRKMLVWTVLANQQHVCNQSMDQTSSHRGKMQLNTAHHQHKYLKVLVNVMVENLSGHLSIHWGLLLIFSVGSYDWRLLHPAGGPHSGGAAGALSKPYGLRRATCEHGSANTNRDRPPEVEMRVSCPQAKPVITPQLGKSPVVPWEGSHWPCQTKRCSCGCSAAMAFSRLTSLAVGHW